MDTAENGICSRIASLQSHLEAAKFFSQGLVYAASGGRHEFSVQEGHHFEGFAVSAVVYSQVGGKEAFNGGVVRSGARRLMAPVRQGVAQMARMTARAVWPTPFTALRPGDQLAVSPDLPTSNVDSGVRAQRDGALVLVWPGKACRLFEEGAMREPKPRRARDPAETREAILKAARTLLAKDGPEGISLSEVAHLAGVNRGTAYQHFRTREKLIEATADWVSDRMFRTLFGDPETIGERRVDQVDIADVMDRLVNFAMDNPELGRIWLLQLLSSPDPAADPFWREFSGSLDRFSQTDLAKSGVDGEVLSVLTLAGAFFWPVWARSHAQGEKERRALADRFVRELLRFSMYGSLQSENFPQIAERLGRKNPKPIKLRAVGG